MKLKCRVIKNWKTPVHFLIPSGNFVANGYGRRYLSHDQAPYRAEAFAAFGIVDLFPEPMFKNFIGNHYLDGAATHEHSDPAPIDYVHTRCNWMVKKPPIGGDPILDGEIVSVDEGDLWICLASLERHATTAISGGERIIYSFGALVKIQHIQPLLKNC